MQKKRIFISSLKMVKILLYVCILLCGLASRVNALEINLVKDGESDYAIVLPSNSSPSQVYSAKELQNYIEQMTGARLNIQTDSQALPAKAIVLGNSKYTAAAIGKSPDMKKLGNDGFQIVTKPPYLLIVGGKKRGTLYGVYDLLEKFGGIRWYSKDFSLIPKLKNWSIPEVNITEIPAFSIRDVYYYDVLRDQDFAARMRSNGHGRKLDKKHGGNLYYGGRMCHTFYDFIPPPKYYKSHPEYFSEWSNGRRSQHGSLCLTNPKVLDLVTDKVLEILKKDPAATFIDLSATDGGTPCICAKCKAVDQKEGTYAGCPVKFCNQVANRIEKKYPHVMIETLAYADIKTQTPPKYLKARHNVVPRVCSVRCEFSRPIKQSNYKENIKFAKELAGWKIVSKKLLVWDYVTNFYHYLAPFPNFNSLQGNLKYFKENNIIGVLSLGNYNSPHGEFAELRAWILAKLLWNPDTSIDKLYDDFFKGYYGAAAPLVREYFDSLQKLANPKDTVLTIKTDIKSKIYPKGFFKKAKKLFARAEQKVQNDPQRLFNVKMASIPVYYGLWRRGANANASWKWVDGKPVVQNISPERKEIVSELARRIEEGKITHILENKTRNDDAFNELKSLSGKNNVVELEQGDFKCLIAPLHGGRVSLLSKGDSYNYLCPEAGGVSFIDFSKGFMKPDNSAYRLVNRSKSKAFLKKGINYKYFIDKHYKLQKKYLSIINSYVSRSSKPQTVAPVLQFGINLDDVDGIYFKNGHTKWQKIVFSADRNFILKTIDHTKMKSNSWTFASSISRRGIKLELPKADLYDKVYVKLDAKTKVISFWIKLKKLTLNGSLSKNKMLNFFYYIAPLKNVSGLPAASKKDHKAKNIVLEDVMIPLISPGYGGIVKDTRTNDGQTLKITNTPTWSMQYNINPELFAPGCKYKVQMLIRAEKSLVPGEIFYAGLYDYNKRKITGQISVKSSELQNGYKWYDIAVFHPDHKQRLWLAPGRYNKKKGKKSAVKNIFVDKIKFTQVK